MRDYMQIKVKYMSKKRPVKKGEVILTSEPFVYVINYSYRGQYCDNCLQPARKRILISCTKCSNVWYCNHRCRKKGWEIHQCECSALNKFKDSPEDFARILIRLLHKLKNGGANIAERISDKEVRRFKDLMNHYRDIKGHQEKLKDVQQLMKVLQRILGEDNVPNESDVIGIYGRLLVNRFCLMDDLMNPIGSALYLAGSVFNHTCTPNAYPTFDGKKLVIRALTDMPHLDFAKVHISYVDIVNTVQFRRDLTNNTWFFTCQCSLCNDEERAMYENSIPCANPICKGPIAVPESHKGRSPQGPFYCPHCDLQVDPQQVTNYQDLVNYTKIKLKNLKEDSPCLPTTVEMVEKQDDHMYYLNAWRVRTLDYTFNAAFTSGVWTLTYKYGKQNMEAMRYYYGANHTSLGLFLMKVGKAAMYLKLYHEGLEYLTECEPILKVSFGPDHALLTSEIANLKLIACEDINIHLQMRLTKHKQMLEEQKENERDNQQLIELNEKLKKFRSTQPIWEKDRKLYEAEREWKKQIDS